MTKTLNDVKSDKLGALGYVGNINEKEHAFYLAYKAATNPAYQVEVDSPRRIIDQALYTEQDLYELLVTLILDLKARGVIN